MKDWIKFLFDTGEFAVNHQDKIQLFIISPHIDFCAVILSSGILHSKFSKISREHINDYENHIGDSFVFPSPSKKDDEMMLYSGVLERVVHNQLFFVVSHTVVEYKTSLGSGKNWRKKTTETGSAKHTKVVREKDFHYVYKIDEKTDLKVNQKGVNFDSVSYYFYGSGSTVLNSRDSKSCLIVDQKKRISKELECKYDLRRTDPNLKKSVRFADIIHPEKIRHSSETTHTSITRTISDNGNKDFDSVILIGSNNYLKYGGNLDNNIIITVVSPEERTFGEAIEKANNSFEARNEDVLLPAQLIKKLPLSFDIQAWN